MRCIQLDNDLLVLGTLADTTICTSSAEAYRPRRSSSSTTMSTTTSSVLLLYLLPCLATLMLPCPSDAWIPPPQTPTSVLNFRFLPRGLSTRRAATTDDDDTTTSSTGENSAMSFLRKIGKVGGPPIDFTNAVGVDEGSGGKAGGAGAGSLKKTKASYRSCVDSGTIDDLTEDFPWTSSGTHWAGVTDRVMGGTSSGTLTREIDFEGRQANVLRAEVRLENDGGFVQMATDLALLPAVSNTVDASRYGGVELDLCYQGESVRERFNVHLKNSDCLRQFSSYRASFELSRGKWTTVRLPWSSFKGFGWGAMENALDPSTLRRIGVVAIGKAMPDVTLALSSLRFLVDS